MGKYSDQIFAVQEPVAQTGPGKYSSQLMGSPEPVAPPQPQGQPEGWSEWMVNSVRGRKDPNFEGVGTVYEQFENDLRSPTATAAMLGASDPQMGDIVAKQLGDRLIRREKDANGYDVFVTRGPDGQEQKGYLNKPGLDTQDVWRGVYGLTPYLATGGAVGAATKGAGILTQALAQGGAAAGTSLAGDVTQMPMGSEQGLELGKAGFAGGAGAIAPPLAAAGSALWRKFVTVPGLVDRSTGRLTAKGAEAARAAGVDPNDFTPDMAREFAKDFAKSGDAAMAATTVETTVFDIPVTRGQITKRPFQLNQEEKMRRGLFGDRAENMIQAQDDLQHQRIEQAVTGGGRRPGVGQTINPERYQTPIPKYLGENIQGTLQGARETAKAAENELWETGGVKALAATDEALATLRGRIQDALKDETAFTTTGEKMAKTVGDFVEKKLPISEAGGIQLKQVQTVDQMRRRLLDTMKSAEPGTDQRQAGMIYDAFNDWIGEAASKSLLAGDPAAAAQLVQARAFTKEVRQLFNPTGPPGRATPAAGRMAKVLERSDSGEGVITALFGSAGSRGVNEGTVGALRQVQSILNRFGGEGGKQAWDDIRLAYWSKLVQGADGKILGAQALSSKINGAWKNQRSVLNTLYSPEELRLIRTLGRAMDTVAFKPPNASGSGYTMTEAMQELFGRFINVIPGGGYLRMGADLTGLSGVRGAQKAREALNQMAPVRRPNIAPGAATAGANYGRE